MENDEIIATGLTAIYYFKRWSDCKKDASKFIGFFDETKKMNKKCEGFLEHYKSAKSELEKKNIK